VKRIIFVIIAIAASLSSTIAQKKQASVAISYPQQLVEYFAQPISVSATVLPLLQAKTKNGDVFGINFQGVAGTAPFIEFLDVNGKIVKTISVNDFLGKSSGKGVKLISSVLAGSGNKAENVYEITTPQDKYSLIVSSLATSGTSTKETPAKLLIRIVLKNAPSTIISAHIILPFDGSAETKANGFIISGKKSIQSIFSTIFPKAEKLTVVKKSISFVTSVLKSTNETVVLFLTVDCSNTKEEALTALQSIDQKNESNISIVNVSNKATAAPSDTVTYQIICTNIGNGSVSDIVITNPVSAGARYLDGSAVGDETQITFENTPSTAPQLGEAKTIKWKLLKSLNAGEEKVVSFKVIVQ
jgi:uncharacterized repeat protein (TIGR01451 family)